MVLLHLIHDCLNTKGEKSLANLSFPVKYKVKRLVRALIEELSVGGPLDNTDGYYSYSRSIYIQLRFFNYKI